MGIRAAESVVSIDPGVMSGTPVFRGTRVPVRLLFDYLSGGETLEFFLDGFPTVSREMALAALGEAGEALTSEHGANLS